MVSGEAENGSISSLANIWRVAATTTACQCWKVCVGKTAGGTRLSSSLTEVVKLVDGVIEEEQLGNSRAEAAEDNCQGIYASAFPYV